MHELSIVEALIGQVQQEIDHSGATGRIVRLDLVIGRLSGVCCDSIRFALELLAPGTPLASAEVRIEEPKANCRCDRCGARSDIDGWLFDCPRCGSRETTVEGGRELLLQSIEIED